MFSRRHPFLFFVLVLSSITACGAIILAAIISIGLKGGDYTRPDIMSGEKIGIVEIKGVITEAKPFVQAIKRFREDDSIKAIVLRIDSPGGGVAPSQEIFQEIRKTVKKKKVVTSMGSVAASGGYYIAAGTNKIVANPGTITGSIGVIMGFTNFQKIFEKIGLIPVVVKSCEYKDIGSPVREMSADETKILQDLADGIHRQFILAISQGRNMEISKVKALADGRIFSGEDAKAFGLVDRLGNMEDAIEWAGQLAGIKGKASAVYIRDKKMPFIKYITETSLKHIIFRLLNPELITALTLPPAQ